MKIFISWSGIRSRAVADYLSDWIGWVLHAARPWVSTRDIESGAVWFSRISEELAETSVGILCLTQDNREAPWILFEAGALAKGLQASRICPLLIDLRPADVKAPLSHFNLTSPDKTGMQKLVRTLNLSLGDQALDQLRLDHVFHTYWPQFEENFEKLVAENPPNVVTPPRDPSDVLSEILSNTRDLSARITSMEREQGSRARPIRRKMTEVDANFQRERLRLLLNKDYFPSDLLDMLINEGYDVNLSKDLLRSVMTSNLERSANGEKSDV